MKIQLRKLSGNEIDEEVQYPKKFIDEVSQCLIAQITHPSKDRRLSRGAIVLYLHPLGSPEDPNFPGKTVGQVRIFL